MLLGKYGVAPDDVVDALRQLPIEQIAEVIGGVDDVIDVAAAAAEAKGPEVLIQRRS